LRVAIAAKGILDIMDERSITFAQVLGHWHDAKINIRAQTNKTEVDNLIDTYFFELGL